MSDYEKRAVKHEQLAENSRFFKSKNARYSKIMEIESTTCGLQIPHPCG